MTTAFKAVRTQDDNLGDKVSKDTATSMDGDKGVTRQEFAAESDINNIIKRFSPDQFTDRAPMFTQVDYDLDLHTALQAINNAKRAHRNLSDDLRQKYPSWRDLLNAAEDGTLDLEYKRPPTAEEQLAAANAELENLKKGTATPPTPSEPPK